MVHPPPPRALRDASLASTHSPLSHHLLPLLLLLHLHLLPTSATRQYFLTLSTTLPSLPPTSIPLLLDDDVPLVLVSLSFPFPFYQPTSQLYIDPNGAIHLQSSTPPCCLYTPTLDPYACTYETPPSLSPLLNRSTCTTDTSIAYTNMIAPFLTDLNPSSPSSPSPSSPSSSVSYADTGSSFTLRFDHTPWWTSNASSPLRLFSFTTHLTVDGSVTFVYDNISDPTLTPPVYLPPPLPPIPRTLLVGLRQLGWADTDTANMGDYNTTRPGTYPPKAWVRTGAAITFCPLDTAVCMSPTQGPLMTATPIALTSANMTCAGAAHNHSYTVTFTLLSSAIDVVVNASYDADSNSLRLLSPAVAASDTASMTLFDVTANNTVRLSSPLWFTFGSPTSPLASPLTLLSLCLACGASNPYVCTADCNGTYFGNASVDRCGRCTGGLTTLPPNVDLNCAGTCGGGSTPALANLSTPLECLCPQLAYPPLITSWLPGGAGQGAYIGPIAYYISKDFDPSVCGAAADDLHGVWTTLDVLTTYESVLFAVAAVGLVLALVQGVGGVVKRPLWEDPFDRVRYAVPGVVAAAGVAPEVVVVQEGGGGGVEDGEGEVAMREAEMRREAEGVEEEREVRQAQLGVGPAAVVPGQTAEVPVVVGRAGVVEARRLVEVSHEDVKEDEQGQVDDVQLEVPGAAVHAAASARSPRPSPAAHSAADSSPVSAASFRPPVRSPFAAAAATARR